MIALWLPIVVSTVALFFASFLSWMVLKLHANDWKDLEGEDRLIETIREMNVPQGCYMFPGCDGGKNMSDPTYQEKYKNGPNGIITVLPQANMGMNLMMTLLYFFVCCCTFAYLASFALDDGENSLTVFRFVATVALLTFSASILQHAIWFRNRVVGHVIESIGYALIAGGIFAAFWPAAV